MSKVVGIKFKKAPKIYSFEAGVYEYTLGGGVIVETVRGLEYGNVAFLPKDVEDDKIVTPLKPIVRLATAKDDEINARNEVKRENALPIAREKIATSKLEMKLVDIEYTFDCTKLVIYFTSEGRVDFRDLVKELASTFKVRIELRQIGSRDECKMLGGISPCGRACCCSDHVADYPHVTIKMAKNQNLSLNPAKISGLCGRLMCCLQYENEHYVETNKRMPKLGSEAKTVDGVSGTVVSINQLKETVRLKVVTGEAYEFVDFPLAQIVRGKCCGQVAEEASEKVPDEVKSLLDKN